MHGFNRLDVFPKFDRQFEREARRRTAAGGLFSIITVVIVLLLIVSEINYFFSVSEKHEMQVDPDIGGGLQVSIDLVVHRVPCSVLTVTAIDAFGGVAPDSVHNIEKTPVKHMKDTLSQPVSTTETPELGPCPSCYGAELMPKQCCRTCQDVMVAYAQKGWQFDILDTSFKQCAEDREKLMHIQSLEEGCRLTGTLNVPRVAGSLHILPGRMSYFHGQPMFDSMPSFTSHLNLSHTFHQLSFGEQFPGQLNPLAGSSHIRSSDSTKKKQANGRFSYFLKVIPTQFESRSLLLGLSSSVHSYQYSATKHFVARVAQPHDNKEGQAELHPGIFIAFEISPIKVNVRREHPYPSVTHLLLQLCAVCGGVLTVAGIVDSLFFHGVGKIEKIRQRHKLM